MESNKRRPDNYLTQLNYGEENRGEDEEHEMSEEMKSGWADPAIISQRVIKKAKRPSNLVNADRPSSVFVGFDGLTGMNQGKDDDKASSLLSSSSTLLTKKEEYYKQIRGLNTSAIQAMNEQMKLDPLSNFISILEQYREYYNNIQHEFHSDNVNVNNETKSSIAAVPLSNATPISEKTTFSFLPTATVTPMPVPPTPTPTFSFTQKSYTTMPGTTMTAGTAPLLSAPKFSASLFSFPTTTNPFGVLSQQENLLQTKKEGYGGHADYDGNKNHNNNDDNAEDDDDERYVKDDTETRPELVRTGAGEEDEITLNEVRCKVYTLKEKEWIDIGIGFAKINQHKMTQKKRLLCRSEGTGKVLLNTYLFPTMINKYELGKKEVMLVCMDSEGRPAKYSLRTKSPQEAEQLQNALNQHKL